MPYNGFPNYETWAVWTHLNDNAWSQQWLRRLAQDAWDNTPPVGPDDTPPTPPDRVASIAWAVEGALRDDLLADTLEASGARSWRHLAADLETAALSRVEWEHIAGALADEIQEQEQAEA